MNTLSACPGAASLQEYLLGGTSEVAAVAVETHLASCPGCRRLLPTIRAEDEFVADFRAQARRPLPKNALLDRLAHNLHGLFDDLPTGREATPPADGEATAPPAALLADTDEDLHSLLAPPQQPDEMGRLGDYRVLKVLGAGGMGVVFLAEDARLRRHVALKAMRPALAANPRARQRFLREAQLTASITHDHVVAVHQVGEEKGVPFLAMPLLQGESLDARLKREGRLPPAEVLRIGRETAEGLAAAHEHGLIHRDVKPANLWLETLPGESRASTPRYRIKVLDFGLARACDGDGEQLTRSGTVVGTPAYMSPEQARGDKVDARGDLFSLGCVLYRLCTGRTPFAGDSATAILTALALEHPKPVRDRNPDVPVELSDLIMRLLAKDPAKRPQSAGEVIRALRALDGAPTVETSSGGRPASGGRRRRPWVAAAVAAGFAAVVAATAAVIIHYTNKDGKPEEIVLPEGAHDAKVVVRPDGPPDSAPTQPPAKIDDAWLRQVAALPPPKQVEAVAAKLKELNPGFDGKVTPTFQPDGTLIGLELATDNVTNISPVRALAELKILTCWGSGPRTGRLSDLSPLKGMQLTELTCNDTQVEDLSPLKDMKRLTLFQCSRSRVVDLSPLSGLPLTYLDCGFTKVSDLTPLKGTKLTYLTCTATQVSKLEPLRDARLERLNCADTAVSDLSPLKGMPLTHLYCYSTRVHDLSPLKGMPLVILVCSGTEVSDLEPLKGMPLVDLHFEGTKVSELEPLRGMQLTRLLCGHTQVSDLSLLAGMPLTDLWCDGAKVSDLSPLKGMPLKELHCDFLPERDAAILRSIPTLETINNQPATQLLKPAEEKKP